MTEFFLFMLFLTIALQWWLNLRQIKHIKHFREKVPDAFLTQISIEDHQKAADYSCCKLKFSQFEIILSSVLILFWTIGGGLNALDQWLSVLLTEQSLILSICFIGAFSLISGLLDLPFSYYRTFVIEEKFGFNRMTLRLFFIDLGKQSLLFILLGLPLITLILWLMKASGDFWWLYAWLVWFGFSLFLMWAYPQYIAPLFNQFNELDNPELKQKIEKLMARCGFISSGILVMDGSKRSSHGNAYFTGVGNNKRIVFYDSLLESLDDDEVEAVLAHELGHFRMHHIRKRLVMMALLTLGGFALLGYLMQQQWFYLGLGMQQASTHAALILFSLVASVFTFPFSPLGSLMSRKHEYEADNYAAEKADANKLISALVKLYSENASTLTPDPIYSSWYDSHPPASLRIANLERHNKHEN